MSHALAEVFLHIVFSTKHRIPFIRPEIEGELHNYLSATCKGLGSGALKVGGADDHLHLICRLSRTTRICDLLEDIKKTSSKWIKSKSPAMKDFAWQAGYWVASVSKEDVPRVIRYIANQRQHHRKITFKEELLQILKEHGVECDERYLWNRRKLKRKKSPKGAR